MFDELGDIAHDKVVLEGQRDDCLDRIADLERSLAASRALVAEQREYIQTRASIHKTGESVMTGEWRQATCQGCQAETILALTEAETLKRLERREA